MGFKDSTLGPVVDEILEGGVDSRPRVTLSLYGDEFEYNDIEVMSTDDVRNYTQAYQSQLEVVGQLPKGDYDTIIYPNRRSLKARLTVTYNDEPVVTTYKAYLLDNNDAAGTGNNSRGSVSDNVTDTKEIYLQLLNPISNLLKGYRYNAAIFRKCSVEDAIKAVYAAAADDLGMVDDNELLGVDMVPHPDGAFPKHEVVYVEDKQLISSIERYFQNDPTYGIYATGVSRYFEGGFVYIFPTYLTERDHLPDEGLTLMSIPGDVVPDSEITFMEDDGLKVIITENIQIDDQTEVNIMKVGNAFNSIDANTLFEAPCLVENGEATYTYDDHNTSAVVVERIDEVVHTKRHDAYIANNVFDRTSKIAGAAGRLVTFIWKNSNASLLYPGMPVTYRWYSEEEVHESTGVLHHVHVFRTSPDRLTEDKFFLETTKLVVFMTSGLV